MKKTIMIILSLLLTVGIKADEGMWMLPSINSYVGKMHQLGLKMSAEDIYSETNTSLKDAIVIFGNGCTGVAVSPDGLIFTNHHCGYDAIQQHSSVEHNYLKNGFVAKELKDEIPSPGLAVTFLVEMKNITDQIVPKLEGLASKERSEMLDSLVKKIETKEKDSHYIKRVKSFYKGNEYYLFTYEKFTDVRFAFAPPSSIGKFGGETDNWMYPRHTGDFSVFRVYCSPEGKPADYSKDNVPYHPKRFAKISNKGYKEGDFTMILGNPGSTQRYATSYRIKDRIKNGNSARIEMRGVKQNVWKKFMRADEAINIAYANKYARSSNYWKNSIGMNKAIKNLNVIGLKQQQERDFLRWAKENNKTDYISALDSLKDGYKAIDNASHAISYLSESLVRGVELPLFAHRVFYWLEKGKTKDEILEKSTSFYKDYYPQVDKSTFVALLRAYKNSVSAEYLPSIYQKIEKKFKGNYEKYADYVFKKSKLVTPEKLADALTEKRFRCKFKIEKDPAYEFYKSVVDDKYYPLASDNMSNYTKIATNERIYQKGLNEWAKAKNTPIYPDANFTMRLTYGTVKSYSPADAVHYDFFTTTKGILEKEDKDNPEFNVPKNLKRAILTQNFGQYKDATSGKMPVAFISNNDITGGNSGSPIFNANGELLGLAFDGNWEAMSGDIVFENNLQRCINVDIRYILFVMDKVSGAKRLVNELEIVE